MADSYFALAVNRQRNILDYALTSLWRQRLKNGGVLLVFAGVIFMLASFRLLTSSLDRAVEDLLAGVPDITVQKLLAGRQVTMKQGELAALETVFGIRAISPRVWGYYFDESNGANYTVVGVDGEVGGTLLSMTEFAGAAGWPEGGDGALILGGAVRDSLRLGNRSSLSLFRPDLSLKPFRVLGSFTGTTAIVTDDLMLMSVADARDLFGMAPDEITDALVDVANPREIDTVAGKIADRLSGSRVVTGKQIGKTYRLAFGWRSGYGLICLFGAAAAFVILAWDKASGLNPEQRREVGLLKALGWQTGDVMAVRFWESVVVATLALVLGFGGALAHLVWFDCALYHPLVLGWSVLRPSIDLPAVVGAGDILQIFTISVLPYLAATIIPAWRSASVRSDAVL